MFHGIATYALAEAYGMTEKQFILPILQKAIRRIIVGQKMMEDGCTSVERLVLIIFDLLISEIRELVIHQLVAGNFRH